MEVGQKFYLHATNPDIGKQGTQIEVMEITEQAGRRACLVAGTDPDGTRRSNLLTFSEADVLKFFNPERREGGPLSHERAGEIRNSGVGTEDEPLIRAKGSTPIETAQLVKQAYDMILRK